MRGNLAERLETYSAELLQKGLYRQRQVTGTDDAVTNFSSNDYLSLTSDLRIKKAYQKGFDLHPTGSGSSMVVCGYHAAHHALEKAFAEALNVDDCMLFSSGYAANLSVMGLLARFESHILIDKSAHASIYDGLQLADAHYSRFLHNNVANLAVKIKTSSTNVIVTEGIFSMSGQRAPLKELAELGHDMVIDEAHAFGILGSQGLGSARQHQLTQAEVPLRIIPFGKACGASGAVVAGQGVWIDALLQSARPHTYSTAISPAIACGLRETLEVMRAADQRREKPAGLVQYFRKAVANLPLKWRDSDSPIQQLQLGCSHRALSFANTLREQSILCLPMRQPTVSKQETGLRVILNYHHEPEQIDCLFKWLHQLAPF